MSTVSAILSKEHIGVSQWAQSFFFKNELGFLYLSDFTRYFLGIHLNSKHLFMSQAAYGVFVLAMPAKGQTNSK